MARLSKAAVKQHFRNVTKMIDMKFSLTPSANRVGLNENVSKIAAGHGGAWRGPDWHGRARLSKARLLQASSEFIAGCTGGNSNMARLGLARNGKARLGFFFIFVN